MTIPDPIGWPLARPSATAGSVAMKPDPGARKLPRDTVEVKSFFEGVTDAADYVP